MLRMSPQFLKMRQIVKRYLWEETMEHSKQYVNCLGIQASLIFTCYNTSLLQKTYVSTCFTNQKKTEVDFCFQGKRQKVKNSIQCLFYGEPLQNGSTSQAVRATRPSSYPGTEASISVSGHQSFKLWESLNFILIYVVHPLARCPKVTAASLYTISACERFHRNGSTVQQWEETGTYIFGESRNS